MTDYKDPKVVLEACENMPPFAELHNGNYPVELFYTLSREALPYWIAEAERLRAENEAFKISINQHIKSISCLEQAELEKALHPYNRTEEENNYYLFCAGNEAVKRQELKDLLAGLEG